MTELRKDKLSSKNQIDDQIKVTINWQHVKEPTPAFRRLMMRLLEPGSIQAETNNGEKDAKEQHCLDGG